MTNRSKSCPPDSRSDSKKRRVELDPSRKLKGASVRGRMPVSIWLGRQEDDKEQDRDTNSQLHFIAQSSPQGLFSESIEEWESNSDSSYTNLSETEASWLLAFDDIMSQVSSKVSGVDELLEVLSLDGEDPNHPDPYSIIVETKNSPRIPLRKNNNRSKEHGSKADINAFQSRFFACVDDFTIEDKFKCMDSSDFWETLRTTCSVHCDDTVELTEMLRAESRDKMEVISRLDSGWDDSPILRTSSGRRVQFEFDMKPIPRWARRSRRRISGLHVIPKTKKDKDAATVQSCLRNPILTRSDGTSRPNSPSPSQGYEASTNQVEKQQIVQAPSDLSKTAAAENPASRNSMAETPTESATAIPQVNGQKQSSNQTFRRKPKLKIFFSAAAVARKVLPLTKKSVVPREQVHPEMDGTEIEVYALHQPSYHVPIDCGPHTVVPKGQGAPRPPDPPALLQPQEAPLASPKPQQTRRAVPKLRESPEAPSRPQVTPHVSPKTKETNSVAPKNQETSLRVEKVNSDITPRKESTSQGSQSSSNSTLIGDWSSYTSQTSEDSASLVCRLVERLSADPSGLYSPQKDSLEGLTIECQTSVQSDEGQFDTVRRRDNQPGSSQKPNKSNPQTSTKRKDIVSNSSQKPQTTNSQASNTRKQFESVSGQEFNGKSDQRWNPREVVQALSSQPANTTNKPIARQHKSETTLPGSDFENNNWFNFNELDENGFPTTPFRRDP